MKIFKKFQQIPKINRQDFFWQHAMQNKLLELDISLLGGNVVIIGKDFCTSVTVAMQWEESGNQALLPAITVNETTITIQSWNLKVFKSQKNAFILHITIPSSMSISLQVFAGTARIEGLNRKINARIRAGELQASLCQQSEACLTVGVGEIFILNSGSSLEASIVLGDINLALQEINPQTRIKLKNKFLGDTSIQAPTNFFMHTKNHNGSIKNNREIELKAFAWLGSIKTQTIHSK